MEGLLDGRGRRRAEKKRKRQGEWEGCGKWDVGGGLCVAQERQHRKRCAEENCPKVALQGGYCVAHGGGRRCQFEGCMKGAAGTSWLCIAHGGERARRCGEEGCEKRALQGGYCIAHGGGRRCQFEGCMKGAAGTSWLCIAHGGPRKKRCSEEGCEKQILLGGYCAAHGGGRRCEFEDCMKSATGKSLLCVAHGGQAYRRKRCAEEGCENESKQGGYCKSHGGGRRCQFEDCMKSARANSSLCMRHGGERPKKKICEKEGCAKWAKQGGHCMRHGGGRRCKFEGCMKSARAKSSFCVVHGPQRRKRCAEGCEKGPSKGNRTAVGDCLGNA